MESDYLTKVFQRKAFHTHRKTLIRLDRINENMFYKKYKNDKNYSKWYCRDYITHI